MKQLYYTSCLPGRSASGQGGFQIRAASPSLTAERRRSLLSYVGYRLPTGYDEDTRPDDAPARLVLLDTDAGRVLLRSGYVGRDPTTNRTGNFFSHVLTDLPADFDAVAAAQLFDAPFWVRADQEGAVDLPDLNSIPALSAPSPQVLAAFAKEHAPLVRFLFLGLLSVTGHQRLFVVAPPEEIAFAVIVVGRMLPAELRKTITFSTYEREPLSSPARIVGTYWREASLDLEPMCYDGAGLGRNTLSGRSSTLPVPSPFAEFALAAVEQRREGDLSRFYSQCRDFPLATPAAIELAFRLVQSEKPLSSDEFLQAIAFPELARSVCGRKGVAGQVVQWALDDAAFREKHLAAVSRHFSPTAVLVTEIAQQAATLVKQENFSRARVALEELAPRISADASGALYDELARLLDRTSLTEAAHLFVLPFLLQAKGASDESRSRWLSVSASQLGRVLDLPLSEADTLTACELALERALPPPDADVWTSIASRPALLNKLLERHGSDLADSTPVPPSPRTENKAAGKSPSSGRGVWQTACGMLISAALKEAARAKDDAGLFARGMNMVRNLASAPFAPPLVVTLMNGLVKLHGDERLSAPLLDDALCELFRSPDFDPAAFLKATERQWLDEVPRGGAIIVLAECVLDSVPLSIQASPTRDFLRSFRKGAASRLLSQEYQQELGALVQLANFIDAPSLDDAELKGVALGLQQLSDPQEREACQRLVLKLAAEHLLDDDAPAESLESILERLTLRADERGTKSKGWFFGWFGGQASRPPGTEWLQTFIELSVLLKAQRHTIGKTQVVVAMAAVGLGGIPRGRFSLFSLSDKASKQELLDVTSDFLQALASNGRDNEVEAVDRSVQKLWQKDARPALRRWIRAFRPKERKGWLDFLLYAIGLALVVTLVVQFVLPLAFSKQDRSEKTKASETEASRDRTVSKENSKGKTKPKKGGAATKDLDKQRQPKSGSSDSSNAPKNPAKDASRTSP